MATSMLGDFVGRNEWTLVLTWLYLITVHRAKCRLWLSDSEGFTWYFMISDFFNNHEIIWLLWCFGSIFIPLICVLFWNALSRIAAIWEQFVRLRLILSQLNDSCLLILSEKSLTLTLSQRLRLLIVWTRVPTTFKVWISNLRFESENVLATSWLFCLTTSHFEIFVHELGWLNLRWIEENLGGLWTFGGSLGLAGCALIPVLVHCLARNGISVARVKVCDFELLRRIIYLLDWTFFDFFLDGFVWVSNVRHWRTHFWVWWTRCAF